MQSFRSRRPHRSFRLTKRRDYVRSLALPGYWAFTAYVFGILKSRKALFLLAILLYSGIAIVLGTMTSQETYRQMGQLLQEGTKGIFDGNWAEISKAGVLSLGTFVEGINQLTDVQRIYLGFTIILTWLSTVWLLREIIAGKKPNLRDGLYNSAAPLVSTMLVGLYLIVQLLPIALTSIVFAGISSVGYLSQGTGMFLFSAVAILVVALTLYWMTSTFIAMVIITLPGMYPGRAIRVAGDLVVGRRLRIIYRILWAAGLSVFFWLAIMIPVVLADTWLSQSVDWPWLDWLPVVPFVVTFISTATAVWMASYVYLLYRKVVDDDAAPA